MTQKSASLVAYLALSARSYPRDELIELLWPEVDPAVSRLRLNQVVSSLRRQFKESASNADGLLIADRWSVGLNPNRFRTDVVEFEALAKSDDASLDRLEQAADLYRGELLPGIYEEWTFGERDRLTALYASVLDRLRRRYRQDGLLEEAVGVAIKLVALDPLQEESHLGLIRLYGLQGRTSLALEQYRRMERALEEIGEHPSEAAQRVIQRIRKGDVPAVERRATSVPANVQTEEERGRSHLPVRLARFFGRAAELDRIEALVESGESRLITLIGPGGVGKTQLALEAGYRASKGFGAVHFAPLADIVRADELADAILSALSQRPAVNENGMDQVAAVFRRWDRSLLVLDNLEHIPEATPLVGELLRQVSGLVVLATSRAPLGLLGEQLIAVEPLAVAPAGASCEEMLNFPSIQLFLERARETRADFALTPRNREAIQAVCSRLDGLPLALELAAGWASTMSPSQMLKGLESRFDFLKSRRRNAPKRHRSLQEAIDYGFALLDDRSQRLLVALSVFQGGFSDDAAAEVAQVSMAAECLAELVERSMVKAGPSGDGSSIRFSMLESLREYGHGRLEASEAHHVRARHAAHFAALADDANRERNGSRQSHWLSQLTDDHRNLLSALEWFEREDPERGLRMASVLDWYWEAKGHLLVGRVWIERLLGRGDLPATLRGRALNSLTWLVWNQNSLDEAARLGEEARTLWTELGDRAGLQQAVYNLGVIAFRKQDLPLARSFFTHALELAEADEDLSGISRVLLLFGNVTRVEGDLQSAKSFYDRSLRIEQQMGNGIRICFILSNLGGVAVDEQEYELAARYYERCVALSRETGHRSYEGVFLYNLGTARTWQGRYGEACQALRHALRILVDALRDHVVFRILWDIAVVASKISDFEAAATLWGISAGMADRVPLEPSDPESLARGEQDAVSPEVRASSIYQVSRTLGRTMSDSEAIAFAFAWLDKDPAPFATGDASSIS